MLTRPLRSRMGRPLAVCLWIGCAVASGAAIVGCGGRAADGLEDDEAGPIASDPGSNFREPMGPVRPYRETCEDNPLLAECQPPIDPCRDNPLASPCTAANPEPTPPPDEPIPLEELTIAAATNVLLANCGACHGSALTQGQASGGINYIDDWGRLIESGLVQPCSPPERSLVVSAMRSGAMPPPRSGLPAVVDADIEVVEEAIEIDCGFE